LFAIRSTVTTVLPVSVISLANRAAAAWRRRQSSRRCFSIARAATDNVAEMISSISSPKTTQRVG
jgi:hypothetical protein